MRLELLLTVRLILIIKDFNSIKVRLELGKGMKTVTASSPFQFHKGAIRTSVQLANQQKNISFQFHKGAIRTKLRTRRK